MQKIIYFLVFLTFFLLFKNNSHANTKFSTDYKVTYTINNNADTKVNFDVVLTNLTEKFVASSYDIQSGFSNIRNLEASDEEGKIIPKVTKDKNGTIITLVFNKQNFGLNGKLNFNFSFNTDEVAQNLEEVWEINIPGVKSQNDSSEFDVNVIYPTFLKNPTFIKPNIKKQVESASSNSIRFTKEELKDAGISMAFGNFQNYDFNLKYHLENKNLFKIKTEIALPPTTNYQEIHLKEINPKPLNVYIDNDGNWLAQYEIPPSKKFDVLVQGNAKVYIKPKPKEITQKEIETYIKPQDYWQVNNSEIKNLVKIYNTPQKIYDYIVKNLQYDFTRVEKDSPRLGATGALTNPQSTICLEFTDLFVTMARAAGIPARAIEGFAYTDNSSQRPLSLLKDILHAWPEYYDFNQKTWIMVDPTWGNTTNGIDFFNTLDFDHLAFVIKGEKSTYPIPAGGYKLIENGDQKDVEVKVSKSYLEIGSIIKSNIDMENQFIAGFPINGKVKIENSGDTAFKSSTMQVYLDKISPNPVNVPTNDIPPFGFIIVNFAIDKTPFLTKISDTVRIAVGNSFAYKNIQILPFFLSKWFLIGGIIIGSTIFIISLTYIGYRSISLLKQRRANNLRRESN